MLFKGTINIIISLVPPNFLPASFPLLVPPFIPPSLPPSLPTSTSRDHLIRVCRANCKEELEKILKEHDTETLLTQKNRVRKKWREKREGGGVERERGVMEEGRGRKEE